MTKTRRSIAAVALVTASWLAGAAAQELSLPLKADSVRFGVIGDNGTGATPQYEVGQQLAAYHEKFPFAFVIMLGDNLYGSERPQDFVTKFEAPYKILLDAKVLFYASLGNHDDPNQRFYKTVQHGGQAALLVQEGQRTVLRSG